MKSPTARANYRLNRGGSKAKFHLGQQTNKLLAEVVLPEQLVTLHPRTSKRTQPRKCRLTYLLRAAPLLAVFACGPGSSYTRLPAASETRRLLRSVDPEKELLIRDLSVVEDPARTLDPCEEPSGSPGAWTFAAQMTRVARQAGWEDPSAFVLQWLRSWEQDQQLNGFLVPGRPRMEGALITPWLQASGGDSLDLARAPFRLLAIVNRMDLRASEDGMPVDAGEARFLYSAMDGNCRASGFSVAFEYKLAAGSTEEVVAWAQRWHQLGNLEFGPDFNDALQQITDDLDGQLADIRTNEILVNFFDWELRAFTVGDGNLQLSTLNQTPDGSLQGSPELASYINEHQDEILAGTHQVPQQMLGGYSTLSYFWNPPGIADPFETRHKFALASCNGCHFAETATQFVHVLPRGQHEPAALSNYLSGENMPVLDGLSQPRWFNELGARADGLLQLLGEQ